MQTIKLTDFAKILGVAKCTILLYSKSYLWSEFVTTPKIVKPGRCYEYSTITLDEFSIPIIREYLESKSIAYRGKNFNVMEKFDEYIKSSAKIESLQSQ